jgi:hypothetical protein
VETDEPEESQEEIEDWIDRACGFSFQAMNWHINPSRGYAPWKYPKEIDQSGAWVFSYSGDGRSPPMGMASISIYLNMVEDIYPEIEYDRQELAELQEGRKKEIRDIQAFLETEE